MNLKYVIGIVMILLSVLPNQRFNVLLLIHLWYSNKGQSGKYWFVQNMYKPMA